MTDRKPDVTPERLLQLSWAFAPPLVIEAAVRHRVFDVLAQQPRTIDELAQATGASVRGLSAIVNVLIGLDLLSRDDAGRCSLTAESEAYLVSGRPGFVGGVFRHVSRQLLPNWLHLSDVVASGKPFQPEGKSRDPATFFAEFVEDIFPLSYPAARALADALGVAAARDPMSVLDLGAGAGVWGIALAQASPLVTVRAIDLPDVLAVTRRVAERHGVGDRVATVGGDLFEADFGSGHQVATLGHILHGAGAEGARALLRRTHAALAPGGTIVIAEFLVDADRRGPLRGLVFAINMLVNTETGSTFSFEEIAGWLIEAGFVDPRLLSAPGPSPLILATKR